ncbi:hypothetical protein Efla_007845 [Eimeria flavescens]
MSDFGEAELHARKKKRSVGILSDYSAAGGDAFRCGQKFNSVALTDSLGWPPSSGKTMRMCVCMRLGRLSRSGRKELRLMHIDDDRLDTMLLPVAAVYIMQDVGLISMSDLGEAKLHAREKKRSVGI